MHGNLSADALDMESLEQGLFALYPLLRAMEETDATLALHSHRVAALAAELAFAAGLPKLDVRRIYFGAMVHDVGKLAVNGEVLQKPGRLTQSEYTEIQRHPRIGACLLASDPLLNVYADIVLHHHERLDGSGYPEGLRASEIHFPVRIVSIADAFDAMTSNRAYRHALSVSEAVHELRAGAGTQFDVSLVTLFERCLHTLNLTSCDFTSDAVPQSLRLSTQSLSLAIVSEGRSRFHQ
jgi:HD-GYP domain-containing protein (c-di-GMP phosphodiesterase class II)